MVFNEESLKDLLKDYKPTVDKIVDIIKNDNKDEFNKYKYEYIFELSKLKINCYIKFFDVNGKYKFGGLFKKIDTIGDKIKITVYDPNKKVTRILNIKKYFIFYSLEDNGIRDGNDYEIREFFDREKNKKVI